MIKELTSILLLTLFLFNSCGKNIVDTDIPQMYVLNLKVELNGKNPLDSLSLPQIKESFLSWPKEQKTVFNAEFVTLEGEKFLSLVTNTIPPMKYNEISYTINNHELFGDDKDHVVVGKWNKEGNSIKLTEILFDGDQLRTNQYGNFEYSIISN